MSSYYLELYQNCEDSILIQQDFSSSNDDLAIVYNIIENGDYYLKVYSPTSDAGYYQLNINYLSNLLGDATNDRQIDILDITIIIQLILQNISENELQYDMCDTNLDDNVDILDIIQIIEIILDTDY